MQKLRFALPTASLQQSANVSGTLQERAECLHVLCATAKGRAVLTVLGARRVDGEELAARRDDLSTTGAAEVFPSSNCLQHFEGEIFWRREVRRSFCQLLHACLERVESGAECLVHLVVPPEP